MSKNMVRHKNGEPFDTGPNKGPRTSGDQPTEQHNYTGNKKTKGKVSST